jgi:hypothetical protein
MSLMVIRADAAEEPVFVVVETLNLELEAADPAACRTQRWKDYAGPLPSPGQAMTGEELALLLEAYLHYSGAMPDVRLVPPAPGLVPGPPPPGPGRIAVPTMRPAGPIQPG